MFGEGSTVKSHYAIVKALALDEDAMPEIVDEIVPNEEGMFSQGLLKHWKNSSFLSMEKIMKKKLKMLPMGREITPPRKVEGFDCNGAKDLLNSQQASC
ncbi:ATP-dependent DNA helicase 2 subunit KU70 isoform X1 [Tanacetum coccineum]